MNIQTNTALITNIDTASMTTTLANARLALAALENQKATIASASYTGPAQNKAQRSALNKLIAAQANLIASLERALEAAERFNATEKAPNFLAVSPEVEVERTDDAEMAANLEAALTVDAIAERGARDASVKVTEKEVRYLFEILASEYCADDLCEFARGNDEDALNEVWAWSPATNGGFGKGAGGVASSLVKKGLAECFEDANPEENTIRMTLKGCAVLRANLARLPEDCLTDLVANAG